MAARAAARLAVFLIGIYRITVSPMLGTRCRFHPTCSEYSAQSIKLHGIVRGGAMSLRRFAKCHPFNPGGYDPVKKQTKRLKKYAG